jgi:hypothetical protein
LIREIFTTEADLIPHEEEKTLTVRLHHLTNHLSDQAARVLAEELNATETLYPGADLRLIYKLVSDENPPNQELWILINTGYAGVSACALMQARRLLYPF